MRSKRNGARCCKRSWLLSNRRQDLLRWPRFACRFASSVIKMTSIGSRAL
jgi:hypothetical protein